MLQRLMVLLRAAPTYLVTASVIVTAVSTEIADALPGGAATVVTKIAGYALAVIGVAAAIVRRVTPVLPAERGLLPTDQKEG